MSIKLRLSVGPLWNSSRFRNTVIEIKEIKSSPLVTLRGVFVDRTGWPEVEVFIYGALIVCTKL